MDNYPPGAANDKNAPYNQRDCDYWSVKTEKSNCDYCEKEEVDVDKNNVCEKCFYDMQESW